MMYSRRVALTSPRRCGLSSTVTSVGCEMSNMVNDVSLLKGVAGLLLGGGPTGCRFATDVYHTKDGDAVAGGPSSATYHGEHSVPPLGLGCTRYPDELEGVEVNDVGGHESVRPATNRASALMSGCT